jgi:hypothetical protein
MLQPGGHPGGLQALSGESTWGSSSGVLAYPFLCGFAVPVLPAIGRSSTASLPIVLDGAGGVAGLWTSPIGVRFATGLVWGAVLRHISSPAFMTSRCVFRVSGPVPADPA